MTNKSITLIILTSCLAYSQKYINPEKAFISQDTKNEIVKVINVKRANLQSFKNCVLRARTKLDVKICDKRNNNASEKIILNNYLK